MLRIQKEMSVPKRIDPLQPSEEQERLLPTSPEIRKLDLLAGPIGETIDSELFKTQLLMTKEKVLLSQ